MDAPLSVTKTIYTVSDFVSWQDQGTLNLRPYFQRGDVWTPKAKSFLIDTLLRGYSVPIIYLQNKQDRATLKSERLVVDGQQRLRTILSYVAPSTLKDFGERDKFSILRTHNSDFAGKSFRELPTSAQDRIIGTELSVHVLPSSLSDQHLLQLFARLNSTGERLNDQELRNAEFHGAFKSNAYNLSYEQLDRWLDWQIFNPRAIAQMRDVELMSELIILTLMGVQNKTKRQIDETYRSFDDDFPHAREVADRIARLFDELDDLYRSIEKRRSANVHTQSWLYTFFAALYVTQYGDSLLPGGNRLPVYSTSLFGSAEIREKVFRLQDRLEYGDVPSNVAKALRGASSDLGSRMLRLEFLLSLG
jgi:hypothetical protein